MEPREERLRTPRAAGTAGLVFAVLLALAIVLMRIALPAGNAGDATVDPGERWAVRTALEILPFAGIFFLWFMGALRAHVGEAEDRFVATVFLGSGLLFVATMYGAGAAAGTVLNESQPSNFGRHFAYTLMTTYALRMAAVFIFTASSIGHRLGVLPVRSPSSGTSWALSCSSWGPACRGPSCSSRSGRWSSAPTSSASVFASRSLQGARSEFAGPSGGSASISVPPRAC